MMTLSENLKKYRLRSRMTQQQLADELGVSHARISEIENDRGNPTVRTLEKLADALRVEAWKLVR